MPLTLPSGVILTVEAALSAAVGSSGIWDTGLFDQATFGPDEILVDISEWVRSINTHRKFNRDLQAWETGTCELDLLNFDGRFSPDNLSGPYVSGGVTKIRPLRTVKITATYQGVVYPIFKGRALKFAEYYVQPFKGGGGAYVSVPCEDGQGALSAFDGYAQPSAGGGELSGARVHRILNNAGYTGERNVDTGEVTMQATTLASNATTELKLTADSEGGAFYYEADGAATFAGQFSLIENTRSNTVQATWGDAGYPELPPIEVDLDYSGDLVVNIASFTRVGGTAQIVADQASRALYEDRFFPRTDLVCETNAQALALAQLWIARYSTPEKRFTRARFKPSTKPAVLWPEVLGRKVRDLVRVHRTPPGGYEITRDCHVSGIHHTITKDDWITDFDLWSARPWTDFAGSLWDYGVFDTSRFFFG